MLNLKEFLAIWNILVNEFRIINEHFEANTKSTVDEYDDIFHRWRQDIQRRFRQVAINHRWATNQKLVLQNTLFFIVRYGNIYNCEVKYLFSTQFRNNFETLLNEAIDTLYEALFRFQLFVITYKAEHESTKYTDFEKEFLEWKRNFYKQADVYAVDFFWSKQAKNLSEDTGEEKTQPVVELTFSQKDNVVFFIKYDLENPPPLIKEIHLEADIS